MRSFVLWALAVLVVAAGCAMVKHSLHSRPAQLEGQVNVDPYDVYIRGPRIYVQALVSNHGTEPIVVNRDAWTLRLPTGEVLERYHGVTSSHEPVAIAPGEAKKVFVDFLKNGIDPAEADGAAILVAGVTFGKDLTPRVIGEIPISQTPMAASVAQAADAPEPPPPAPAPAPAQAREQAPLAEPAGAQAATAAETERCVPGRSVGCVGPAGCAGFQVCTADGSKFEACQCEAGAPP